MSCPADKKYLRDLLVAQVVAETLERMDLGVSRPAGGARAVQAGAGAEDQLPPSGPTITKVRVPFTVMKRQLVAELLLQCGLQPRIGGA